VRAVPSRLSVDKWNSISIHSINGKTYAPVNLDRIAHWIEQGRLTSSPENPITAKELVLSGCIHNAHDGVKLLGDVRHLSCLPFGVP
jgi:Ribosomal proteins 50S-L15, 50S-L18e, 60S-L27A